MKLPGVRRYPKEIEFNGDTYHIRFVKKFKDKTQVGEYSPSDKTIRIKLGQTRKEIFATFIHELIHLVEMEHHIKLSHVAVYKLEEAFVSLLTSNL